MDRKEQVYQTTTRLESLTKRLNNSDEISSSNFQTLQEYKRQELGTTTSANTVEGTLNVFYIMREHINFDLETASEEHLRELVAKINQGQILDREISPWTKLDFKRTLQRYYKWLEDTDNPQRTRFISVYLKKSEKPMVDPDNLVSPRQVEDMINAAKNPRDKALIGLLYDTGMRISELLCLDVGDIKFRDELMGVHVRHGKNGPRKIYAFESIPLMKNWLKEHPGSSSDEPLFVQLQSSNVQGAGSRMSYRSAYNACKCNAERAGLREDLRFNPHGLRRARATEFAKRGMNQPSMNQQFGWVSGSNVPIYYIRLAKRDLENNFRDMIPGLERKNRENKFIGENISLYPEQHLKLYEETLKI